MLPAANAVTCILSVWQNKLILPAAFSSALAVYVQLTFKIFV